MDMFDQALEEGEGQGSLAYCSPWGRKELDTMDWINWTEDKISQYRFVTTKRAENTVSLTRVVFPKLYASETSGNLITTNTPTPTLGKLTWEF